MVVKGEVIAFRNESEESLSHLTETERMIIISVDRDIGRASRLTQPDEGTEWVPDTPLTLFTRVVNLEENKLLNNQLRKVLGTEDESYISRLEQELERYRQFVHSSPEVPEIQALFGRVESYVKSVLNRMQHLAKKEVLKKGEALDESGAHPLVLLFAKKYLGAVLSPMTAGDIFGERALQGNFPRTASVFTRTRCFFLTVNQDDYNTFLKREQFLERVRKQRLLYDNFPGCSEIPEELYWRFDRLFEASRG